MGLSVQDRGVRAFGLMCKGLDVKNPASCQEVSLALTCCQSLGLNAQGLESTVLGLNTMWHEVSVLNYYIEALVVGDALLHLPSHFRKS